MNSSSLPETFKFTSTPKKQVSRSRSQSIQRIPKTSTLKDIKKALNVGQLGIELSRIDYDGPCECCAISVETKRHKRVPQPISCSSFVNPDSIERKSRISRAGKSNFKTTGKSSKRVVSVWAKRIRNNKFPIFNKYSEQTPECFKVYFL